MVFTQGPPSVGKPFDHKRQNALVTFLSDGDSDTPSFSVQVANLWYNLRDTFIVRFVSDGCRKNLPLHDLPKSMAKLPDWIIDELTRFATGERGWNQWGQWIAVSAARLAQDMPRNAFSQLKANPETEVIRQVAAAGVSIVPHTHPVLVSHPLDNNTHFRSVMALANELAETEAGDRAFEMGGCHLVWTAKKRILKTQFGLEWQTPAELNPDACFD